MSDGGKHTWVEDFEQSQRVRALAKGRPADSIPEGPPLHDRTDMDRPAYWYTDLSEYPNALFNLFYVDRDPHPAQQLQLLYPEGFDPKKDEPIPLLIFVHGGGFRGGNSRENGRELLYTVEASLYALGHGYAVASVDYRMLPEVDIMEILFDVKAAVRYLRANAGRLGLDANRFAITGESAGGYLVNMIGVTGDHPDFEDKRMGNGAFSSKIAAVISWYSLYSIGPMGYVDHLYHRAEERFSPEERATLARFLSPGQYITADTPPFFLQHGTGDTSVGYSNSVEFYQDLCAVAGEGRHRLELIPEAEHAVRWFITRQNGEKMVGWLNEALARR